MESRRVFRCTDGEHLAGEGVNTSDGVSFVHTVHRLGWAGKRLPKFLGQILSPNCHTASGERHTR